jgi:preprotein translocase subunit SecG
MSILINILLGLYVFVAVLMILVILMQRPKSEGLGAAFGGGVTENIFGAQTTNVLTKITGWMAAIFFLLTFVLSILYAKKGSTQSDLRRELMKGMVPTATATPTPAAGSATATPAGTPSTPIPGPSSAVGPPGTVTNPAPATTGPVASVKPSDLAVGAVPPASGPVSPATSPATAASPSASPSASASPRR